MQSDAIIIAGGAGQHSLAASIIDLLAISSDVSFAVRRIRLSALGGISAYIRRLSRCRLVLGRLDVHSPELRARRESQDWHDLHQLREFAISGRLAIRSGGAVTWDPDFSVFNTLEATSACLLGAHYISPPRAGNDWPLTCLLTGPSAVREAQNNFEAIWAVSHDVLPAVVHTLERELGA